jgi:hypothetical protein
VSCSEILAQEAVKAQTELGDAEIALLEATARAEVAREAAQRLVAACAALRGEIPVGPSATVVTHGNNPPALDGSPEVHELMKESLSAPVSAERAEAAAMSPEEFDKERRRKQRKREKEEIANNPLGHLKCPGCGEIGHMTEQIITTEKGGVIKALICGKCGNQAIM